MNVSHAQPRTELRPADPLALLITQGVGVHPVYQPIRDKQLGLFGFEALARLNTVDRHFSGGQLIPRARALGLLPDLGRKVHALALREIAAHHASSSTGPVVALNVSAEELSSPGFHKGFLTLVDSANVDPSSVTIEITEDASISDLSVALIACRELKQAGISISLDDFGAGSNGLLAMRSLPVDQIKLDRGFLKGLVSNDTVVVGVIELAHQLGLKVVGEGIEDEAQFDLLAEMGCDLFQGYWVGRPAELPPPTRTPLGFVAAV